METKEQSKFPQDQINEEEIGNLPEKKIRKIIAKMIHTLEKEWRHGLRRYKKCLTRT